MNIFLTVFKYLNFSEMWDPSNYRHDMTKRTLESQSHRGQSSSRRETLRICIYIVLTRSSIPSYFKSF